MRGLTWLLGLFGAVAALGFLARAALVGVDERALGVAAVAVVLLLAYAIVAEDRPGAPAPRGIGDLAAVLLAGVLAVGAHLGLRAVDTTWSWRTDGAGELSEHGLAVLAGLPDGITLYGVFPPGSDRARAFEGIGRQIEERSAVRVERIDPQREVLAAQALGVHEDAGSVVVQRGDHLERLGDRLDETSILNALTRAADGRDHVVCWSTGHREAEPDADRDPDGISAAVVALEGQRYAVRPVSLLQGPVPADCEALVIAAPRDDWQPAALGALDAFVGSGGRALLLLEPDAAPALAAHLAGYGLRLGADVVLDPDPARRLAGVDDPSVLVFRRRDWSGHPVGEAMSGAVILGVARSVVPAPVAGTSVHALLHTSPSAWGETARDPGTPPSRGPDEATGSLPVLSTVEVDATWRPGAPGGGRLVVVGDATFATNRFVDFASNQELFLDLVGWLVDDPTALTDRPDLPGAALDVSQAQAAWLALYAWVLLPGFGAAMALLRWRATR